MRLGETLRIHHREARRPKTPLRHPIKDLAAPTPDPRLVEELDQTFTRLRIGAAGEPHIPEEPDSGGVVGARDVVEAWINRTPHTPNEKLSAPDALRQLFRAYHVPHYEAQNILIIWSHCYGSLATLNQQPVTRRPRR